MSGLPLAPFQTYAAGGHNACSAVTICAGPLSRRGGGISILSHPCTRLGRQMYTIKHAAEMVGVPVTTLRAWQRRYRVVNPGRSDTGYRLYRDGDIAVLRRMQALVASGGSP